MIWLGLYDSAFAALAVMANADGLVVGDSVGPNALGLESTDDVTLDHMVHHASAVRRGAPDTPIIVDLPVQTRSDASLACPRSEWNDETGAAVSS